MKANHVFDTIYGQNFFSNVPAFSYRASVFIGGGGVCHSYTGFSSLTYTLQTHRKQCKQVI